MLVVFAEASLLQTKDRHQTKPTMQVLTSCHPLIIPPPVDETPAKTGSTIEAKGQRRQTNDRGVCLRLSTDQQSYLGTNFILLEAETACKPTNELEGLQQQNQAEQAIKHAYEMNHTKYGRKRGGAHTGPCCGCINHSTQSCNWNTAVAIMRDLGIGIQLTF